MKTNSLGWRLTMLVMSILSCAISWWFYARGGNEGIRWFWMLGAGISAYEGVKVLLTWLISPPVPRPRMDTRDALFDKVAADEITSREAADELMRRKGGPR